MLYINFEFLKEIKEIYKNRESIKINFWTKETKKKGNSIEVFLLIGKNEQLKWFDDRNNIFKGETTFKYKCEKNIEIEREIISKTTKEKFSFEFM